MLKSNIGETARNRFHALKERWEADGVKDSPDLQRILALPRRPRPTEAEQSTMAEVMTSLLTLGPVGYCECAKLRPGIKDPCITKLFPVQGWYLWEAMTSDGVIGHLAAGAGKTGIDILLAMVVPGVRQAALLIPPELRTQFYLDYRCWAQHFRVPSLSGKHAFNGRPMLDVLAYSELSNKSCATWLKINKPNIVIGDELQNLRDRASVRTDRFIRFFTEVESRLFGHSGSLTTRSPEDFAHFAAISLGDGSPVPIDPNEAYAWSEALGSRGSRAPGVLQRFCQGTESVRSGFRRRLVETKGVITTEEAAVSVPVSVKERKLELPPLILKALAAARRGKRPDFLAKDAPKALVDAEVGETLEEHIEVINCAKQLASGFFYRWKYPRGEPEELIIKWFKARKAWNAALRRKLEHREDLLDSPSLCREAAERFFDLREDPGPKWACAEFPAWLAVEKEVQPEQDTVWLDDFLAHDAVKWGQHAPGIIWYEDVAIGRRVSTLGGFPLFEGGDEASAAIAQEDGSRTIVASASAHSVGKNLQAFYRMLVITSPANGGAWEQTLARCHRYGQTRDVECEVYLHTQELTDAYVSALADAKYVVESAGASQRLLTR